MMARYDRTYLAGRYLAQEARRAGQARAHDNEYAMGRVVNTDTQEAGEQYGQGVAGGELRGNRHEVPQAQRPNLGTCEGARDAVGASVKVPAGVDAPALAGRCDPRVAPQTTFLPLRELRFELPLPPSVNALYGVNHRTGQKFLLEDQRRFRSVVISIVRGQMRREEQRAKPLLGRLQLVAQFYFADRRVSDVSNRIKALEDALTHAGAYRDDSQIDDLHAMRIVGHGEERCEVTLTEIAA
jgi:crossover junction endodeoxyribonuclease RusA